MTDYTLQLSFFQDVAGEENAQVMIKLDDEVLDSSFEISSSDEETPNTTPEYTFSREPGTYTLSVVFLNDEFVDTANDRNVIWCNTLLNGWGISWTEISYNEQTYTATLTPELAGWFKFKLWEGNKPATYQLTLPYTWD